MRIRHASQNDLNTLLSMGEKMHLVEKKFEPLLVFSKEEAQDRYKRQLKNPDALFLLAVEGDQALGYLYAHAETVPYLDTNMLECEIEVVFVESEYRGQGIAQMLIDECVLWSKTKNVFRIKSGIFADNISSQAAFTKARFKPHHMTYVLDSGM
jgi:GNAT superfamily N-acetyltransferase